MNKKFTLIELLVVVAIIGILAAMILPALGTARDKAQQKTCTNNLKQIGTAMIMYFSDGSETNLPIDAAYFAADTEVAATVAMGNQLDLVYGALSCNAKRVTGTAVADKVYGSCQFVSGNAFAALEDPQTRIATDGTKTAGTIDSHKSGGKANVLAGDGHVEATTLGFAQVASEL
mgnify:CR=1 FL=1